MSYSDQHRKRRLTATEEYIRVNGRDLRYWKNYLRSWLRAIKKVWRQR